MIPAHRTLSATSEEPQTGAVPQPGSQMRGTENTQENQTIALDLQRGSQPSARNAHEGQRDPRGRFVSGNVAALRHGDRSRRNAAELQPEIAAVLLERERAILAELGGAGNVSTVRGELVARFVQASAIADALARDFLLHGVVSPKGHTRRSVGSYMKVLDRLHRLAGAIGLDRRQRPVGIGEFVRG